MALTRVLITVKTYPTLSQKYGELVCTAGIRSDGSWVRLYPIPFRRLYQDGRYKKYDWIETAIVWECFISLFLLVYIFKFFFYLLF